jgi:hypothetical protein
MAHEFTPAELSLGGRNSVAKKQREFAQRALRSEQIARVVSETEDLAPETLAGALAIAEKLRAGIEDIEIDSSLDAVRLANVMEVLHRVSRLASGQSTSNQAVMHMSDEERKERMAYLRSLVGQDPPQS